MDIASPWIDLGPVDSDALSLAVLRQGADAWRENEARQRAYDVHHQTESIVLAFCDDAWPDVTVRREAGWPRLAAEAEPVMRAILDRAYPPGGTILRAMAAKLKPGARIMPHIDHLPSFRAAHRIHVPLTDNPRVRFTVDGLPCPMRPGRAIEINNQRPHSVLNDGASDRISFIFDYLPPTPGDAP